MSDPVSASRVSNRESTAGDGVGSELSAAPAGDVETRPARAEVAFVVIGRNEERTLRACLESIRAQTYAGPVEILYVDSRSTDRSVEIAESVDGVRTLVVDDPQPNAAKGRNVGWRHATAELIQFVDGDTTLLPEWTEHGVEALADDRVAAVYGWYRELHPERSIYNRMADVDWPRESGRVDGFGGIVMIRRSCLEETGGFPELAQSGEEPLLAIELRQRGHALVQLPVMMAYHDIDLRDFGSYWRRCVMTGVSEAEQAHRVRSLGGSTLRMRATKNALLLAGVVVAIPLVVALGLLWSGWVFAAAGGLIAADLLRLALKRRARCGSMRLALAYALHCRFMLVAQTVGYLRWRRRRREHGPDA